MTGDYVSRAQNYLPEKRLVAAKQIFTEAAQRMGDSYDLSSQNIVRQDWLIFLCSTAIELSARKSEHLITRKKKKGSPRKIVRFSRAPDFRFRTNRSRNFSPSSLWMEPKVQPECVNKLGDKAKLWWAELNSAAEVRNARIR